MKNSLLITLIGVPTFLLTLILMNQINPPPQIQTDDPGVSMVKVSEVDGVKVYRFMSSGRTHRFIVVKGDSVAIGN